MIQSIFYFKMILTAILFIRVALKALKNRSEQDTLFFVLLFVLLMIDARRIIDGRLPTDLYSELGLVLIIVFMGVHTFKIRGVELDYKQIFNLEIFKGLEQSVAILKKGNLEVLASNELFKQEFKASNHFITIEDIVSQIHSGNSEIEVLDFNNNRRVYKASLKSLGLKHVILYLEDITAFEELENLLKEEDQYYKSLWDHVPNQVMIRTLWGEVVYMNKAMERFTNKTLDQIVGCHYLSIYSHSEEAQAHETFQRGLSQTVDDVRTSFLRYTTERGHVKFYELTERVIVHQNEKHIITNAVDSTVKAHTDLLLKSYEAVQRHSDGENRYPVLVLDFMKNDLLFIERVNPHLKSPIESYKQFARGVGEAHYKYLIDLYKSPERFEPFELVYMGTERFYVECFFSEEHGFTVGALLKHISPLPPKQNNLSFSNLILNHINEGLLLINFEGEIEYANDYFLRRLKYSKEELLTKKLYDITKGLSKDMMRRSWVLSRDHASLHFDRVYLAQDGEEVEVEVVTIHTEKEKLLLLIREKNNQQPVKNSSLDTQNGYAHLFDTIDHQLIEVKLPQKDLVFYNSFTDEKGLQGRTMSFIQWLNDINDNDRSIVYESIDSILLYKKDSHVFEYRYFNNGEWQWIRANGKYTDLDKKPSILIATQNISEIKTMGQKLEDSRRILHESERISQMAHWKYDVLKNQFMVSGTFSGLVGVNILSGLIHYEQLLEHIEWTDRHYFENQFKWFVWHNKTLDLVVRILVGDEIRYIQFLGQIYLDEDKAPVYAIGTVANVSERINQRKSLESEISMYHHMHDHSPIGLALIMRSGEIKRFNSKLKKMLNLETVNIDGLREALLKIGANKVALNLNEKLPSKPITDDKEDGFFTLAPVFDEESRYLGNQLFVYIKKHHS